MNALKELLTVALRIIAGVVPPQWSGVITAVATMIAASNWGENDNRWTDVARVVGELLTELEQAGALTGTDLATSARAVAEVRYTQQLRALGLLPEV